MTQKEKAHEIVKAMLKNGSSFIENSNSLEEDSQFGYVFVKEAVDVICKDLEPISTGLTRLNQANKDLQLAKEAISSTTNDSVLKQLCADSNVEVINVLKYFSTKLAKLIKDVNISQFAYGVEYYKKNIENAFPSLMNTDSEGKNLVATGISSEVLDKIEVINLVLNTKNENQMFLNNDVKKALSRGLVQGVANEKEMLNIKESLSTVNKNKM